VSSYIFQITSRLFVKGEEVAAITNGYCTKDPHEDDHTIIVLKNERLICVHKERTVEQVIRLLGLSLVDNSHKL
jgi:hypothetical protein